MPGAEEGAAIFQKVCVSAEFRAFAANESSPVTVWLRSLARLAHDECGGPGVGAIGMCVLPDSAANPDPPPFFEQVVATPHSVLTAHLIDQAGQPTIAARDEILSFFAQRLA